MANRPWRKLKLQVETAEKWISVGQEGQDVIDASLPQVGGHGAWDKDQAMQINKKGLVMKPIQQDVRGQREVQFYKDVFSDPSLAEFTQFMPQFHGVTKKTKEDGSVGEYLVMENLTNNFSKACIMDVKIGAKTYGPDATPEKMAQQDKSYKGTKVPFGFSVPGLNVFSGENKDEVIMKGKDYGKTLTENNIDQLLEMYLDVKSNIFLAKRLASLFVEELQKIAALFETQTKFHFFASSLLFVYDAEGAKNNKSLGSNQLKQFVNVKMIDFAHVWPAPDQAKDQNYAKGVQSLIQLFSKV